MILIQTEDKDEMFNVWDETDLFLTTTCSTLHKNKELAIGTSHYRHTLEHLKIPDLPLFLGKSVLERVVKKQQLGDYTDIYYQDGNWFYYNTYGLMVSERWPKAKLGMFQTQTGYNVSTDYEIVEYSARMLKNWCDKNPSKRVDMPFAGKSDDRNAALGVLKQLPDTVHVWEIV